MKILAVAGASGGHIYPALAFLERAKINRHTAKCLLVLPSRSIKFDYSSIDCKIQYISSARLSFALDRRSISSFFIFSRGAWEGLCILLQFKPDIVVGFGSIDTIPLVLMAWFFRIKTVIHEQNVLPGKANRFLSRFADKVAISFSESNRYLNLPREKIALTGNPIRNSLKKMAKDEALSLLGLDKGKFTILVIGGSQGSRRINSVFINALGLIKEKELLQVIHISGREEYATVTEKYKQFNIKARVFGFSEEMGLVYSAANLAVARAGATTLAELIYFRLAAVIVPYPFAYSHQSLNAVIMEKAGLAFVIEDNFFNQCSLKALLEDLIFHPEKISGIQRNFNEFPAQDSAFLLADLALKID